MDIKITGPIHIPEGLPAYCTMLDPRQMTRAQRWEKKEPAPALGAVLAVRSMMSNVSYGGGSKDCPLEGTLTRDDGVTYPYKIRNGLASELSVHVYHSPFVARYAGHDDAPLIDGEGVNCWHEVAQTFESAAPYGVHSQQGKPYALLESRLCPPGMKPLGYSVHFGKPSQHRILVGGSLEDVSRILGPHDEMTFIPADLVSVPAGVPFKEVLENVLPKLMSRHLVLAESEREYLHERHSEALLKLLPEVVPGVSERSYRRMISMHQAWGREYEGDEAMAEISERMRSNAHRVIIYGGKDQEALLSDLHTRLRERFPNASVLAAMNPDQFVAAIHHIDPDGRSYSPRTLNVLLTQPAARYEPFPETLSLVALAPRDFQQYHSDFQFIMSLGVPSEGRYDTFFRERMEYDSRDYKALSRRIWEHYATRLNFAMPGPEYFSLDDWREVPERFIAQEIGKQCSVPTFEDYAGIVDSPMGWSAEMEVKNVHFDGHCGTMTMARLGSLAADYYPILSPNRLDSFRSSFMQHGRWNHFGWAEKVESR